MVENTKFKFKFYPGEYKNPDGTPRLTTDKDLLDFFRGMYPGLQGYVARMYVNVRKGYLEVKLDVYIEGEYDLENRCSK